jgi:hypothetical protein
VVEHPKVIVAWFSIESAGITIAIFPSAGTRFGSSSLLQLGSITATANAIIIFFIVALFL